MEDNMIIELYWDRNENAISETNDKYKNYLLKIAFNILGNQEDSEECVNDTYLKIWNAIPPHRPNGLKAFIGKIARERAIDIMRKKTSVKRLSSEYLVALDEIEECIPGDSTPEKELEAKELASIISKYLYSIKEDYRNIFVCKYYYMDSIQSISEYSGYSESKIKTILFRTRKGLKKFIQNNYK